jgi:hypothetical protein
MGKKRTRGFAPWSPRGATQQVLEQVQQVLIQYRELLPLTARQVFYRLVGAYGFPKTEADYKRLLEYINRARRSGLIPWTAIRDDGAVAEGVGLYSSADDFLSTVKDWAGRVDLDLLQFQPVYVEVLCEAAGMVPQLQRVAEPFGIPVRSSGGFDSTTVKHDLAVFYARQEKPVKALHVGDLDPSGVHLHSALQEDLDAFLSRLGGSCDVVRVGVDPSHVEQYGLPTDTPKAGDKR